MTSPDATTTPAPLRVLRVPRGLLASGVTPLVCKLPVAPTYHPAMITAPTKPAPATAIAVLLLAIVAIACGGCHSGPPDYGDWSKWMSRPADAPTRPPSASVAVVLVPEGVSHPERVAGAGTPVVFIGESHFYADKKIEPDDEKMHDYAKSIGADIIGLTLTLAGQHTERSAFSGTKLGLFGLGDSNVKTWKVDASFWGRSEAPK
jgi:hypothetical protein